MLHHKRRHSAPPFELDETVCEAVCQHPSCWRSQRRIIRGLPRKLVKVEKQESSSDEESGLPTQKIFNLLDEYGPDPGDRFPTKYKGVEKHMRPGVKHSRKPSSLKTPRRPMVTPATSFDHTHVQQPPAIKSVEVQELFEFGDLAGTYADTFVDRPFLVWVPNPEKQIDKQKRKQQKVEELREKIIQRVQNPGPKDVTEDLVPRELEEQREKEILQKQILKASVKSPPTKQSPNYFYRPTPPWTPRSEAPGRVFEMMNFSSSAMLQIMEHVEKYNLTSKEQISELIQCLAPENLSPRDPFALVGSEVTTHQKQAEKTQAKKAPAAVNTAAPVFQLAPDAQQQMVDEYPRYKTPLPSIQKEGVSSHKKRIVSLGLPELPPGVQSTKPFHYKHPGLNFVLEAHSVGSSVRSGSAQSKYSQSESSRSSPDHMREDTLEQIYIKQYRQNLEKGMPLHAISPADSTNVPHTPQGTPVTKTPTTTLLEKAGEIPSARLIGLPQELTLDTRALSRQKSPAMSREVSGMAPIAEQDAEELSNRSPMLSRKVIHPSGMIISSPASPQKMTPGGELQRSPSLQLPQSRKSVRFAPGVKPNTTPNSEVVLTPTSSPPTSAKDRLVGIKQQSSGGDSVDAMVDRSPRSDTTPIKIPTVPNTPAAANAGTVSPEVEEWPQVNEADYDVTPEPRPIRILGSGYDHPDSKMANFDSRSVKSSTLSHQRSADSRESLRSEMNRKRMTEASPGPPPPSPDPKTEPNFDDAPNSAGDVRREYSTVSQATTLMTPLIEEESDGEMTISADPPSRIMSANSLRMESERYVTREKMLDNVHKMDEITDSLEELENSSNKSRRSRATPSELAKLDDNTMRVIEDSVTTFGSRIDLSAEPPERLFSHEVSPVPSLLGDDVEGGNSATLTEANNNVTEEVTPCSDNDNLDGENNEKEPNNNIETKEDAQPSADENANKGSVEGEQMAQLDAVDNDSKVDETLEVTNAQKSDATQEGDITSETAVDEDLKTKLAMLDMGNAGDNEEDFKAQLREELKKIEDS